MNKRLFKFLSMSILLSSTMLPNINAVGSINRATRSYDYKGVTHLLSNYYNQHLQRSKKRKVFPKLMSAISYVISGNTRGRKHFTTHYGFLRDFATDNNVVVRYKNQRFRLLDKLNESSTYISSPFDSPTTFFEPSSELGNESPVANRVRRINYGPLSGINLLPLFDASLNEHYTAVISNNLSTDCSSVDDYDQ